MALGLKAKGLILLGLGAVIIIVTTVIAGVLNIGVNNGIKNIWVYEHDSKYDDPNYEDCSNETRSYYLYNITNVHDFLYNGKKMVLELKGPYNYTVETCKFNFTVVDDTQYYKQYLKEPIFVETPGLSNDDVIYAINPGYNALLKLLRQSIPPGVEPEFLFSAQISGSILEEMLSEIQTPSSIQQIALGASPVMLAQAKQQFITAVKSAAETITMSGYIAQQYLAGNANNFFNNHTFPGGVSYIAQQDLGFSQQSIALILNGNGASNPGILNTVYTGAGVVYLLTLADASQINATAVQLATLQSYLAGFPEMALAAQVTATQSTLFYTQWVSSGVTTPTDINRDGIPDLELSANDTGISTTTAALLWNATSSTSVASSIGFGTWYEAAFNSTILFSLQSVYNLTSTQSSIIANWAVNWANNIAPILLNENYGINNNTDLAYAQWGLGTVFGGLSLHDLKPEAVVAPPEFAFYTNFAMTFDAAKSKALLTDPVNGLLQFENMWTLFSVYESSAIVQAKWNISVAEATVLAQYFSHFITTFSDTYIQSFFVNYASGPVMAVTPFEFIWSRQDPLLKALGGYPYTGFAQEYPFYTKENPQPKNNTIFRGGSVKDLHDFLQAKTHSDTGNSTLYIYKEPYQVSGWNGAGFTPNFEEETAGVWFDLFLRVITFVKGDEYDFKGITVNRYTASNTTWQTSTEYPDNDFFYSGIHGTVNVTSYYKPELYGGYPDYQGGIPYWKNATIISPRAKWNDFSIYVEPVTGVTLKVTAGLCAYYMYHPSNRYYPGLNSTGLVPIWGQYSDTEATDDDVSKLNTLFKAKKAALVLNIVGPVVGGVIITIGFVLIAYMFRKGVSEHANSEFELEVDKM